MMPLAECPKCGLPKEHDKPCTQCSGFASDDEPEHCEHQWQTQRVGGSPDDHMSLEAVIYCLRCGRERQEFD